MGAAPRCGFFVANEGRIDHLILPVIFEPFHGRASGSRAKAAAAASGLASTSRARSPSRTAAASSSSKARRPGGFRRDPAALGRVTDFRVTDQDAQTAQAPESNEADARGPKDAALAGVRRGAPLA